MDWLSRLKEMKNTSGKTTKEIADLSGVPEPTLEKLFAGNTRDPRLNTISNSIIRLPSRKINHNISSRRPDDRRVLSIAILKMRAKYYIRISYVSIIGH